MKPAPWVAGLLDLLLPAGCLACGTWIPVGRRPALVCGPCRSRIRAAPWPRCDRCHHPLGTGRSGHATCRECRSWPAALTRARYVAVLAPPADALVHALKYEGWCGLAEEMGRDMAALPTPPRRGAEERVVVPIPTTRRRIKTRGYNQAALLAQRVAAARSLPLVEALVRRGGGGTQVALHPSQRKANVKGAFSLREGESSRLRGAHVLLVDDVLTTGATAGAAALELARSGAVEVTLMTYARALPFRRRVGS